MVTNSADSSRIIAFGAGTTPATRPTQSPAVI
jgi:hypothetical protein